MNVIIGFTVFAVSSALIVWLSIRWARKTVIERIKSYGPRAERYFEAWNKVFERNPDQKEKGYKRIILRSLTDITLLAADVVRWSRTGFENAEDVLTVVSANALRFERLDKLFQSSFTVEHSPELKLLVKVFSQDLKLLQRMVEFIQAIQKVIGDYDHRDVPDVIEITPSV